MTWIDGVVLLVALAKLRDWLYNHPAEAERRIFGRIFGRKPPAANQIPIVVGQLSELGPNPHPDAVRYADRLAERKAFLDMGVTAAEATASINPLDEPAAPSQTEVR